MPLTLEIVTPEKKVFKDAQIDAVLLTTTDGEIEILPGHIPLLTTLQPGEIRLVKGDEKIFLAVDKGFARVFGDVVSVLAEAAIDVKYIDEKAIEQAQKEAEDALKAARTQKDIDPAEIEKLESVARFAILQRLIKKKR